MSDPDAAFAGFYAPAVRELRGTPRAWLLPSKVMRLMVCRPWLFPDPNPFPRLRLFGGSAGD